MVGCPTNRNQGQVDESSARKGLENHSSASYRKGAGTLLLSIPRQVERNPVLRENDSIENRYRSAVPRAMTRPAHNLTGT